MKTRPRTPALSPNSHRLLNKNIFANFGGIAFLAALLYYLLS